MPDVPPGSPQGPLDPERWGPARQLPSSVPVPPPPPPPRRNLRLWATVGAVVVVLAGGGTAAGLLLSGGEDAGPPPAATVRTYLSDLASGDAAGALAQGGSRASGPFLTDGVLREQQRLDPITAVRIGATSRHGDHAEVHADYRFGSRRVSADFALTRHDGRWGLDATTVEIDLSALSGIPSPTVFGRPVGGAASIRVFPGPVRWGSGNRYFAVKRRDAGRFALWPRDPTASYTELSAGLNKAGRAALLSAVRRYVATCRASHSLNPRHCPQQQYDQGVVPGSVRWKLVTDLTDALRYRAGTDRLTTLEVRAHLFWSCTYRVRVGKTRTAARTASHIAGDVNGTVDLTAARPVLTPGS